MLRSVSVMSALGNKNNLYKPWKKVTRNVAYTYKKMLLASEAIGRPRFCYLSGSTSGETG